MVHGNHECSTCWRSCADGHHLIVPLHSPREVSTSRQPPKTHEVTRRMRGLGFVQHQHNAEVWLRRPFILRMNPTGFSLWVDPTYYKWGASWSKDRRTMPYAQQVWCNVSWEHVPALVQQALYARRTHGRRLVWWTKRSHRNRRATCVRCLRPEATDRDGLAYETSSRTGGLPRGWSDADGSHLCWGARGGACDVPGDVPPGCVGIHVVDGRVVFHADDGSVAFAPVSAIMAAVAAGGGGR